MVLKVLNQGCKSINLWSIILAPNDSDNGNRYRRDAMQ